MVSSSATLSSGLSSPKPDKPLLVLLMQCVSSGFLASPVLPNVIKESPRLGFLKNEIPDSVSKIILQEAFINMIYFVERSGNMKAKGIARIVKLFAGTHIFPGSPFLLEKVYSILFL